MESLKSFLTLLITATLLGCGGGGGGSSSSAAGGGPQYVDSWPIYSALSVPATSYGNKNDARILRSQIDDIKSLPGITSFDADETHSVPTSLTLGDFYHEGQLSAFVVVNRSAGQAGKIYFLRWKDDAKWVDDTSRILSNRNACVTSQFAITADFNHDGKPDVFLSCGGSSEEQQLVFLSSPTTGAYTRVNTGITVKGNRAAAADLDGDSYPDIVVSNKDGVSNTSSILVLKGSGTGTFSAPSSTWLSNCSTSAGVPEIPTHVDQVFLVPTVGGRTDLIVSGELSGAKGQMWLRNQSAAPYFTNCAQTASSAKPFPTVSLVSGSDAVLVDLFYVSMSGVGNFYGYMQTADGAYASLKKLEVQSDSTLNLNLLPGVFSAPTKPATGFPSMFRVNASNQLITYDSGCSGTASSTRCGLTFALQ